MPKQPKPCPNCDGQHDAEAHAAYARGDNAFPPFGGGKLRFRVIPPAPLQGMTMWGVLDKELEGVMAFIPAEAQARRVAAALNALYTVVPAMRDALTGKP